MARGTPVTRLSHCWLAIIEMRAHNAVMRPSIPSHRLLEIRGQLADLVASPRDTVAMFDIRYDGLRKLEAHLLERGKEQDLTRVAS